MSENSGIEWTDHTFNPWIGCTKVSPACDHCYAERTAKRMQVQWGAGQARKRTSASYWREPLKWNARAERTGRRERVFCASLADVFDNEVDPSWRADLFALIRETPCLDWLLLTKRIGNVERMLPSDWGIAEGYRNVWLGATVVNQEEADRDIPKLLATPARVRFLSMEPLLGPVWLRTWNCACGWSGSESTLDPYKNGLVCPRCRISGGLLWDAFPVDWVIVGGESGPHARPMHPDWARSLRNQCEIAGVPFFFKQWGEWAPNCLCATKRAHPTIDRPAPGKRGVMFRCGKKAAGRELDGRTWDEVPE